MKRLSLSAPMNKIMHSRMKKNLTFIKSRYICKICNDKGWLGSSYDYDTRSYTLPEDICQCPAGDLSRYNHFGPIQCSDAGRKRGEVVPKITTLRMENEESCHFTKNKIHRQLRLEESMRQCKIFHRHSPGLCSQELLDFIKGIPKKSFEGSKP